MTQVHTLTSGTTISSQYGAFGIANRRMIKPLHRVFGHLFGRPCSGKTSLFSSYAGALIINCDGSSTPTPSAEAPPPAAQFFPGFDPEGFSINATGSRMTLTWGEIEKLVDTLVSAAVENRPRPTTVVLDSVMVAMQMIKSHLILEANNKRNKDRGEIRDWTELHGEAAWESLYNKLLTFAGRLLPYYGVWFITHLADKYRTVGEAEVKVLELTTPPGFLPRFNPLFEMAIGTETRLSPTTKEVINMFQGTAIKDKITTMGKKVFLTGETLDLANLYKSRIALPVTIELPPGKEWETLSEAYKKAAVPVSN